MEVRGHGPASRAKSCGDRRVPYRMIAFEVPVRRIGQALALHGIPLHFFWSR